MRFWNLSRLVLGCRRRFERQFCYGGVCRLWPLLLGTTSRWHSRMSPALIEQARGSFKPVSEQQLTATRADALKQVKQIEQFVAPSSKNGQRWMRYLRWDGLKEQLANQQPKSVEGGRRHVGASSIAT